MRASASTVLNFVLISEKPVFSQIVTEIGDDIPANIKINFSEITLVICTHL